MSKEPDSLKWIDRMEPGSIFWDIGANIGTLTLYAARREVQHGFEITHRQLRYPKRGAPIQRDLVFGRPD